MKFSKTIIFLIAFLLGHTALIAQDHFEQKLDCFTIMIGKNASWDGSVLFAHNEDDGGRQVVNYFKVPRKYHQPGEIITFRNGGTIPQVGVTAAYLWLNLPGMEVSDSYFNEYGVAIGSDGCPSREKNPELKDGGLVYWLRRIVAERAHTAREGVKIAGKLIEEFGYASSGRTYGIADPNEAWMLSVVNGKHWVAQRVPDDEVAILPNYYIIGQIDLSDTLNYVGATDIIDYAIAQGWYNPDKDGAFNFAKAYSNPGSLTHPGNTHRKWRGINLLSDEHFDVDDDFPFSIRPSKKVSVRDVMRILRDHYEGTMLDNSGNYSLGSPYKLNRAPICAHSTQYSFIANLRNWLPSEIKAVVWIAPYRPDVQAYVPWYVNTTKIPKIYGNQSYSLSAQFEPSESMFDPSGALAYWTFKSLTDEIDTDYGAKIHTIQDVWKDWENEEFKAQKKMEDKIAGLQPAKIIKSVTHLTNNLTEDTYKKVQQLQKNNRQ